MLLVEGESLSKLKIVSDFEDIGCIMLFVRHKNNHPKCRGPLGQSLFLLFLVINY